MKFKQYLVEVFHINYVKKNVGDKLVEKFSLPIGEVLEKIKDADPTHEKYLMFVATAWLEKRKEDIDLIKTNLHKLHSLGTVKTKGSLNLLNLVEKNKTDLVTIIKFNKQHETVDTTRDNPLEDYEKIISADGIDVYEVDKFVCIPGTDKHELFHKTSWCVQKQGMFNDYKPPYFLFVRGKELLALYHINSLQFMDVNDEPIDEELRELLYPAFIKLTKLLKTNNNHMRDAFVFVPENKVIEFIKIFFEFYEQHIMKSTFSFLGRITHPNRLGLIKLLPKFYKEKFKNDKEYLTYFPKTDRDEVKSLLDLEESTKYSLVNYLLETKR